MDVPGIITRGGGAVNTMIGSVAGRIQAYFEWKQGPLLPLDMPKKLSEYSSSIRWLEDNAKSLCSEVQRKLKGVPRDSVSKITDRDLLEWRQWLLWRILMAKQENEI